MITSHIKSLLVATQLAVLAIAGTASATTGMVYVADEGANTVSVIDAASFKQTGSIPVGLGPHNVQVSPDGKWVWVTNNGDPAKAADTMPAESMPKAEHGAMAGAGAVCGTPPIGSPANPLSIENAARASVGPWPSG